LQYELDGKVLADAILNSKALRGMEGSIHFWLNIRPKDSVEPAIIKSVSRDITAYGKGKLINDSSDYDVEIRLISVKDGKYLPFLKFPKLEDKRFSYRVEYLPVSMPANLHAFALYVCKDYLKEKANVLDPFCGVGTMLIERRKYSDCSLYGTDIFGEAIGMARENASRAGVNVNFINRDFFDFTHEYLFDEILTEMPYASGKFDDKRVEFIYKNFFLKATKHLSKDGVIMLVSRNKSLLQSAIDRSGEFKIEKEVAIDKKGVRCLFVITRV